MDESRFRTAVEAVAFLLVTLGVILFLSIDGVR